MEETDPLWGGFYMRLEQWDLRSDFTDAMELFS